MRLEWKHLRATFGWVASAFGGVALVAPAGEFVIVYLQKHHAYDNPDRTVATMMGVLLGITSSSAFHWLGGIAIGFALCVWLDAIMLRRETNGPRLHKQGSGHAPVVQKIPPSASEPDYAIWDSRDGYRLYQVAYLWAEKRPPATPAIPKTGRPAEAYTMLKNAIESKKLDVGSLNSVIISIGATSSEATPPGVQPQTYAKRESLLAYARSTGQRPKFLFPEAR